MNQLQRRVAAAQAAVNKFEGQEFVWGKVDCFHIVAFTLKELGSPLKRAKLGSYSTPAGAKRVLKNLGYDSLESALNDQLVPIGAASVLPADIVGLPGEENLLALGIALGNGRVLGMVEDHPTVAIIQPLIIPQAWRSPVNG